MFPFIPLFIKNSTVSTGGSSGSSYPKVDTYADLPTASTHTDEIYFVRQTTGTWILGTEKKSGHYYSNGTTWTYAPNIDRTLSLQVGAVLIDNAPEVELIAGDNFTLEADATAKTVTFNAPSQTDNNFTDALKTVVDAQSGTNTGDETQSSIVTKLGTELSNKYDSSNFVSGTDFLAPDGDGSSLTGLKTGDNLLVNSDFSINQRDYVSGTNTTSSNQYTLDRWRVVTSGQALTWADSNGTRTVTVPAGGIEQVIEGSFIGAGYYTLSWNGTATAQVDGSSITNGSSVSLTGGANLTIKFSNGTLSNAKLEKGTVPTTYLPRTTALELAICQRYFCRIQTTNGYHYHLFSAGIANSTSYTYQFLQLPTPMRSTPTFSYSALSDFNLLSNPSQGTITEMILQSISGTGSCRLRYAGTLVNGNSYFLEAKGTSSAYLDFDAEF